jgi:glycosyltransferase involved in cell wall biosynthesis
LSDPTQAAPRPRVLFVTSAAFNRVTGGGITFGNLFRGWPADRLATVHNDMVPTTDDVCRLYYRLSRREIDRWPRRTHAAEMPVAGPAAAVAPPGLVRRLKTFVIGNAWPDAGRLTPQLAEWIDAFRPQLLYTILGTIGMMELIDAIRTRFGLPLVIHFMDDWPSHLYRGGLLSALPRARMEALIHRLVGAARARLAIGAAMARVYGERYGVPFTPFQNALDLASLPVGLDSAARPIGDPAQLLYVGSIFDNAQFSSLVDIAQAVAGLAAAGRRIRLDIHSPAHLAERFRPRLEVAPCVRLHDTITDDAAFFRRIAAADLLVLPVNFDADSLRLVRFSMPTKLPAYLASGTPVLVYGPREAAQVAYAADEGWGHVVGARDAAALRGAVTRLLDDQALRARLVGTARAVLRKNHDAAAVRRRFHDTLTAAAS